MAETKKLLCEYIELIERVLAESEKSEDAAITLLGELKVAMGEKRGIKDELFEACVYNALATINTVPNQRKMSTQLTEALCEAKEEMKAIAEMK